MVIHAVYLINCASKEREIRAEVARLARRTRCGSATGSAPTASCSTPGARKGEPHGPSVKRAGKAIAEALGELGRCPLLLENTAGTKARWDATSTSSPS